MKIPIDPTRGGGGLAAPGRDHPGHSPGSLLPIPGQARARPTRPPRPQRATRTSAHGWVVDGRGRLRRSCRVVRPKFYGERETLVAEGGSLIEAREVRPSVPPSWISGSGDGSSLYEVGLTLLQELSSEAAQPFSPAIVIKRGRLRARTGVRPFVCSWTGRRVPGVVVRGCLTRREAAYTVRLTSPLTAWCSAPGREGGE